jgi:UDP-GlcNAc:undecaprenyl-phosphate GlcNAc-1-phosphate transferase
MTAAMDPVNILHLAIAAFGAAPMIQIYLSLAASLFISMLLTPLLTRYASSLGLMDLPDARKSHIGAIPRVGGIAIALGALLPSVLWLGFTEAADGYDAVYGYFGAALVILAFGIWDDRSGLDYRLKLLGQLLAVLLVVATGVEIHHLPFAGLDPVPQFISLPLTVFFLIAVTNAFNLLDGLDGLAGGCAMLSLGATAFLAFLMGGNTAILLIAAGLNGAILGFLRHNTYPATVFMGDAGSQFLGFTIGVLVIMLMQQPSNAMSAAVPLLLLGLPILDTAMVILLRLKSGQSPFAPDRNHIHHKLLSIGLLHHEAVGIIYAVQALIVFSAALLRFEADWLVITWYLAICAICVTAFLSVRRMGWRFHGSAPAAPQAMATATLTTNRAATGAWQSLRALLERWSLALVGTAVVAYLVAGAIVAGQPTTDLWLAALFLSGALPVVFLLRRTWFVQLVRAGAYSAALIVTYLAVFVNSEGWFAGPWANAGIVLLSIVVGLAIYLQERGEFEITTLDVLIVIVAVAVITAPIAGDLQPKLSEFLLRVMVIFYSVELLLGRSPPRARLVAGATLASLLILALSVLNI